MTTTKDIAAQNIAGTVLRRNAAALKDIKATHTVATYHHHANNFEADTDTTAEHAWHILSLNPGAKLIDRRHIDGVVIIMIHPRYQWYCLRTAA